MRRGRVVRLRRRPGPPPGVVRAAAAGGGAGGGPGFLGVGGVGEGIVGVAEVVGDFEARRGAMLSRQPSSSRFFWEGECGLIGDEGFLIILFVGGALISGGDVGVDPGVAHGVAVAAFPGERSGVG